MIVRVLPSRFYSADPADLADSLIAARDRDAAYQAKRAIDRAMGPALHVEQDRSHRYIGTVAKQRRIRALLAQTKKGQS